LTKEDDVKRHSSNQETEPFFLYLSTPRNDDMIHLTHTTRERGVAESPFVRKLSEKRIWRNDERKTDKRDYLNEWTVCRYDT